MYTVRNSQQNYEFDGVLLARSSSQSVGRTRWVEFELYRTTGGQYVLSRVGRSLHYHSEKCKVVKRNNIKPSSVAELATNAVPCRECNPVYDNELDQIWPEQPRYWAQVSQSAHGVIKSLYKWDEHGTRYLTNVARRLLSDASQKDYAIQNEFVRERVN